MAPVDEAIVSDGLLGVVVTLPHDQALFALEAFASGGYESLVDLLGTDTGEGVEITYHVRSYSQAVDVFVKCALPYEGMLDSVWSVYPSALMPERETAELLGLHLSGHPNPKRLFTTEGMPPLLRKSVEIRTPEEFRR